METDLPPDDFHAIADAIETDWNCGGFAGTIYEEFAWECCKRYMSAKEDANDEQK